MEDESCDWEADMWVPSSAIVQQQQRDNVKIERESISGNGKGEKNHKKVMNCR